MEALVRSSYTHTKFSWSLSLFPMYLFLSCLSLFYLLFFSSYKMLWTVPIPTRRRVCFKNFNQDYYFKFQLFVSWTTKSYVFHYYAYRLSLMYTNACNVLNSFMYIVVYRIQLLFFYLLVFVAEVDGLTDWTIQNSEGWWCMKTAVLCSIILIQLFLVVDAVSHV